MSEEKKRTYGLAMIVKDCAEILDRALSSVIPANFDQIVVVDTGSKDGLTKEVAKKYGAEVYDWVDPDQEFFQKNGFISDFGAARNFSFSKLTTDYCMWLDSDDVVVNAKNFRKTCDYWIDSGYNDLVVKYNYGRTEDGRTTIVQWRERVVERGKYTWFPFYHEVLLATGKHLATKIHPDDFHINHSVISAEDTIRRHKRGLLSIEYHEKKDGGLEARMWKHKGQHLLGLDRFEDGIECFKKLIAGSNSNVDIYHSRVLAAEAYRKMNRPVDAIEWDLLASELIPEVPNAYAGLAYSEMMLCRWNRSLHYSDLALKSDGTIEELWDAPVWMETTIRGSRYKCFYELGKFEDALAELKELRKLYRDKKEIDPLIATVEEVIEDNKLFEAYHKISQEILKDGDDAKVDLLAKAAPNRIRHYGPLAWLGRQPVEKRPSIAFYCPAMVPEWGPESIEKGVGGSEEAVIFLSRELARRGYWVDVFANTKEAGEKENPRLRWYDFNALRPKDTGEYDILIGWRDPGIFLLPIKSKKKILWLHDLHQLHAWPDNIHDSFDYVIPLSGFHANTLPVFIPKEKVFQGMNGLDLEYLAPPQNNSKRVIFPSNPARGLDTLLSIWREVHERTGAFLHTYYGFTGWHKIATSDYPFEQAKMANINRLMSSTPGVINHGMIGQKRLAEENAKAGVFAYPTEFPEISCITAMRAQAMGAVPVCTNFAALDETVQFGVKVPLGEGWLDRYKEELIAMINDPARQEEIRAKMIPWARATFDWRNVADQFETLFGEYKCSENRNLNQVLNSATL